MAMTVGDVVRGLRGSYRIEARHGEGAFGVAYRAVEESSGARLIVKELRIERLEDWKALELFEREGRVLAGLAQRVQSAAAVVSMTDSPPRARPAIPTVGHEPPGSRSPEDPNWP